MPDTASLPRSLPELRALAAAGGPIKYLFFWGHQPQPDGSIGPGCLRGRFEDLELIYALRPVGGLSAGSSSIAIRSMG